MNLFTLQLSNVTFVYSLPVGSQDFPNQVQARQEAEAESSHSPVDQDEDRQHDPIQRQAQALEEDQAQALNLQSSNLFDYIFVQITPCQHVIVFGCVY